MVTKLAAISLMPFLLSGCTDEAKIDQTNAKLDVIAKNLQKEYELRTATIPTTCFLTDLVRNQEVCVLATTKNFAIGEMIRLGDDIWRVDGVRHYTKDLPQNLRDPAAKQVYMISETELLVTFQGNLKPTAEPKKDSTPH